MKIFSKILEFLEEKKTEIRIADNSVEPEISENREISGEETRDTSLRKDLET